MKTIRKADIKYHLSAPHQPSKNPAEGAIKEINKRWYAVMQAKHFPKRLKDFGITWVCETNNITVTTSRYSRAGRHLRLSQAKPQTLLSTWTLDSMPGSCTR